MQRFTTPDVRCRVHTRKDGLLSRMGHDLCFELQQLELNLDDRGGGEVHIDPMALVLLGTERDGHIDRRQLSKSDQRRVHANLRQDVLDVRKYPSVIFAWEAITRDGPRVEIAGTLQLHGTQRPLILRGEEREGRLELSAELDQRDYGIPPFSAAFGALKVQPQLRLEVSVALRLLQP